MADDIFPWNMVGAYPTCNTCGGRDVLCDAWACWSMAAWDWEIASTFDTFHCETCDGECDIRWRIDDAFRRKRIRRLNDKVRHGDLSQATVVVTQGVRAWGEDFVRKTAEAVIAFDDFTEDNDPHGEHDFGAFEIDGQKLFWKIDPFDRNLQRHSPDAANPKVTHRVLTIMLASEY